MQQNRRITDNLLAGGSYAIYAGQKQGGPPTSKIVITGNQISTMFYRAWRPLRLRRSFQ